MNVDKAATSIQRAVGLAGKINDQCRRFLRIALAPSLVAIGLVTVAFSATLYFSEQFRGRFSETLAGDWGSRSGSNLGGVIAGLIAATVGVAGAYWAASKATRAGVDRANRLENERAAKLAERELFYGTAKRILEIQNRIRDITEPHYEKQAILKKFNQQPSGKIESHESSIEEEAERLGDSRQQRYFLSVVEVDRLMYASLEVKLELSSCLQGDPAIFDLRASAHRIHDVFRQTSQRMHQFEKLAPQDREPALDRAISYLKQQIENPDIVKELYRGANSSLELEVAPAISTKKMSLLKTAEALVYFVDGRAGSDEGASVFFVLNDLLLTSFQVLQRVAQAHTAIDGGLGSVTNVLSLTKSDVVSQLSDGEDELVSQFKNFKDGLNQVLSFNFQT